MKLWDVLDYTVPSQEIEIWIRPMFSNTYVRYATDIWDEIRNDYTLMETLKAATLANFAVDTRGILVVHGIEA